MYLDLLERNKTQCDLLKGEVYSEVEDKVPSQDQDKTNMKINMLRTKQDELIGKPVGSLDSKQDQENAIPLYLDLLLRNETHCDIPKGRKIYDEYNDSITPQDQNMYACITENQMGSVVTTDIQSDSQYQGCGEDVIISQDMDMHICLTESQMEPGVATDIPVHGRRHTINRIPAVSKNDQVVKTTNQSNYQCSKRHLTLIALLSVTVCVAIAAGIMGFVVKYPKHIGMS